MRVAVYHNNRDIRIEERPVPRIGAGEFLLRVEASGICGSDVMEWYRVPKAPAVLGHEIAGTVEAIGSGVSRVRPGDRVVVSHHVPCGACRYCRAGHETVCDTLRTTNVDPGGFAEFLRVPAANVEHGTLPLPDGMSFHEGVFAEPLGCAVRGQRLAGTAEGRSVLVIGSGLAGLLHIALARVRGASRVFASDVLPSRLEAARRTGADVTLESSPGLPDDVREANEGRGVDLVIAATGAAPALAAAVRSVDRGGAVLFFAPNEPGFELPIPFNALWREEVTLRSSYGASPGDLAASMELLRTHRIPVADLVTHRLGLAETPKGFALTADGRESLKVIIEPQR